jgi:uncharacterized protein (DUF1778 family)
VSNDEQQQQQTTTEIVLRGVKPVEHRRVKAAAQLRGVKLTEYIMEAAVAAADRDGIPATQ